MQISRNAFGLLCYTDEQGSVHEPVIPVRAFPLTASTQGISLMDEHGHEQLWIADLAALAPHQRQLLESELSGREFMPEIQVVLKVSSYSTPSRWQVITDRGQTQLLLKGEDDIRRLPSGRLLITADNGLQFSILSVDKLDHASRRRLERFL